LLMIFLVMSCYLSSSKRKTWKFQAWTGLEPWPRRCGGSWATRPIWRWSLSGSMISQYIVDICVLIDERAEFFLGLSFATA